MSGGPLDVAEDESFADAFDRLFRVAYRAAFKLLGSREDAEDMAIEALARASLRWKKLQPEPDPWVTTVAVNLAIDLWRRKRRADSHARKVELPTARGFDERRLDLLAGLLRLPRKQRETIVLRFFADLTEVETAASLGVSVGTVKQHTARALARLRGDLDGYLDPDGGRGGSGS
jgi:RNA polymerase sigma factor (sigma-70 family)